jgi:lipopolysaccharide export system protein LptC
MRLFGQDNLHSLAVTGLKIFLPLVALTILSTLFLISTTSNRDGAVPYADVNVADLLREPRLTSPSYAGMTSDGAALTLTAREALPGVAGTDQAGLARDLSGLLETPDGVTTRLTAGEVRLDNAENQVLLGGGVNLSVSTGYSLAFNAGWVSLDETRILAAGGVAATGPMGTLSAQNVETSPAKNSPGHYVMVFNGGVRLLYQP